MKAKEKKRGHDDVEWHWLKDKIQQQRMPVSSESLSFILLSDFKLASWMSLKSTKKQRNKTQAASYLTSPENAALGVPHYNRKSYAWEKEKALSIKKEVAWICNAEKGRL